MSLYLEISACNHMVYLTFPFSSFFSLDHSSCLHSFSSRPIFFWWWLTLKRYLCYTLYIVKAKKNSKELVWRIIMVDREWCGSWGGGVKTGKVKEMKIVQMQILCEYG
jgi:hypothetical protein